MRHHGSYRRRSGGINVPLPLVEEPLPRVLRDEPDTTAAPLFSEGGALPLASGEGEALPLIHHEVEFDPFVGERDYIDPLNNEPMA